MSALSAAPALPSSATECDPLVLGLLERLLSGYDLDTREAGDVLARIMNGSVPEAQVAAFLVALRAKGETAGELAGMARVMRLLGTRPPVTRPGPLVDTAGTGGGRSSFNVSTAAALIAAGAGCGVAKHGNRSFTSRCGSSDVIEALGGRLELGSQGVARCVDEVGFGFIHAPLHHRAAHQAAVVRRQLGTRTVFNLLGPLTNPTRAERQVIGVADPSLSVIVAHAARMLGAERALVVSSEDGLDELSATAVTHVLELRDGLVEHRAVTPRDLGAEPSGELPRGGSPRENARVIRAVLAGAKGPAREAASINAGAAIYVAGRASTLAAGTELARRTIDSGAALAVLERFVELSQRLGRER
jgi:anthranilate phosphoribosyltransferase